ncbi:unnamed protein product [Sphagnum compactum]
MQAGVRQPTCRPTGYPAVSVVSALIAAMSAAATVCERWSRTDIYTDLMRRKTKRGVTTDPGDADVPINNAAAPALPPMPITADPAAAKFSTVTPLYCRALLKFSVVNEPAAGVVRPMVVALIDPLDVNVPVVDMVPFVTTNELGDSTAVVGTAVPVLELKKMPFGGNVPTVRLPLVVLIVVLSRDAVEINVPLVGNVTPVCTGHGDRGWERTGMAAFVTSPVKAADCAACNTPVSAVVGRPVALVSIKADGVPKDGVVSVGDVANTTLPLPVVVTPANDPALLIWICPDDPPGGVAVAEGDAHVPSPRQKVEADADAPEARFATGRLPVTPVESGSPVAFVRVIDVGVPRTGVVSVGDVANTTLPVPVVAIPAKLPLLLTWICPDVPPGGVVVLDGVAQVLSPRRKVVAEAPLPPARFAIGRVPVTPVGRGSPVALVSVRVGALDSTTLPVPVVAIPAKLPLLLI